MQYADRFKLDPFHVWHHTPMWMIEAGHRSIPRLRALDSLRHSTEVAVGTASFKHASTGRSIRQQWERDAHGGKSLPKSKRGFEQMMGSMGIERAS